MKWLLPCELWPRSLSVIHGFSKVSNPDKSLIRNDWRNSYTELANAPAPQLYDLSADPGEIQNTAATHPEIVQRLQKEIENR